MRAWFLFFLSVFVCPLAAAQLDADKPGKGLVTVNFNNTELRVALREIHKQINVSYSVDPQLDGRVTLTATSRHFREVLREVLLQVNGIYHVEAGILLYRRMEPINVPPPVAGSGGIRPRLKMAGGPETIVIIGRPYYQESDINLVLKEMFAVAKLPYKVDPALRGFVTFTPRDKSFDENLGAILKQVDAAWRIEDGRYVILRVRTS
jgi:type II secretory pathway component GspD/PulD (secretin)